MMMISQVNDVPRTTDVDCSQPLCPYPYVTLPYLTLPYGQTFYRLALRPLTGPMRIPELTERLQNPQVQYSPGPYQQLEPSPS